MVLQYKGDGHNLGTKLQDASGTPRPACVLCGGGGGTRTHKGLSPRRFSRPVP